jgi:type I restriction enzyme S subunit
MAKQNKPAIRFKGFTDAWEQRKLGEVVERITRKNENLESTLPLTISAQYGLINQNEFFDKRIASKDVSGYFLVRNGEFAYNKSTSSDAPWGAIKRLDSYESGVLSTLYIVFKILDERKTSSDYIVTYYNTDLWHKGIQAIAAEGARNHGLLNVAPADFFETNLTMPKDYAEQQQIGSFFQQLDHLITLHQRKYDKLQVLKKAMLEKMFPKNGSSVPEIRFKGFTDAWEQRKLEDYLTVSAEKNTDNLYTKKDVLSVSGDFGVVNQIEFQGRSFAGASVSNYGVVHTGDVVYTKSPLKANPYGIIKANKGKPGIVSVLYGVYHTRENANADFIQMYFEQDARLNNYLRPLVNKGAKNTLLISDTDALEGEVCLAPTFDEQKAIGQFFDSLDNLITLHQRELEKLQNIKKSMLEKMFV